MRGMTSLQRGRRIFQWRPDAEDMEEAITKFLDGMEGQERSGFKQGSDPGGGR